MNLVDFLVAYWRYISIAIVVILDVLILLLKRNKVIDPSLFAKVVTAVMDAEEIFGSGEGQEKLNYVIEKVNQESVVKYSSGVIKHITELVLSTPTKKGGFGREKIESENK